MTRRSLWLAISFVSLSTMASAFPDQTMAGYGIAIKCYNANTVAKFLAEKSGDPLAVDQFELGSMQSNIFAQQTGRRLGLSEELIASDLQNFKAELDRLLGDRQYLVRQIGVCREVGLIFDN